MGALYRFDLSEWITKYNLVSYVELGFGDLSSFKHALKYNFKKYYGVDLDHQWVENAKSLESENIKFYCDYSTSFLKEYASKIEGPALWFLDSHFVSSDYRGLPYDESIRVHKRHSLPLEDEILIIKNNRDISKDVFICDDFFLYSGDDATEWTRSNPFQHRELVKSLDIDLSVDVIYRLFYNTHSFKEVKMDQSYLICLPNE